MLVDEIALPAGKDDRPLVLAPRPVLWQQARPVHPVAIAVTATDVLHSAGDVPAQRRHGAVDLARDAGIAVGARNPQPGNTSRRHQVAIAEVLTEEVGIGLGVRARSSAA